MDHCGKGGRHLAPGAGRPSQGRLADAELLGGHPRALDAGLDLLEGHVAGIIGRAVVGLHVDAEGREAAIVGRCDLLLRDVIGSRDQLFAHLLGRFDPRVLRVDDADIGHLRDAVGIGADARRDVLVDLLLVPLALELDHEIAGIELEHARQQVVVGHVGAVHRIAVAAGAGVDADVHPFLRREAVEHSVDQIDEVGKHLAAGPGVARIVAAGEPALGEVDRDPDGARGEGGAHVLLALVDQVGLEGLARVALDLLVERIEQRQHRGRDDRLLHRLGRGLDRELERIGGEALVAEGAAGQPRQLAMVAVGEDGEILAAPRQMVGEAGSRKRVGDRIGREARPALLAVGDDGRAGRLHARDRIPHGLFLLGLQVCLGDLALVVGGVGGLKLGRSRQGPHGFGGNAGVGSRIVAHGLLSFSRLGVCPHTPTSAAGSTSRERCGVSGSGEIMPACIHGRGRGRPWPSASR